jgi:hypothetical protein
MMGDYGQALRLAREDALITGHKHPFYCSPLIPIGVRDWRTSPQQRDPGMQGEVFGRKFQIIFGQNRYEDMPPTELDGKISRNQGHLYHFLVFNESVVRMPDKGPPYPNGAIYTSPSHRHKYLTLGDYRCLPIDYSMFWHRFWEFASSVSRLPI